MHAKKWWQSRTLEHVPPMPDAFWALSKALRAPSFLTPCHAEKVFLGVQKHQKHRETDKPMSNTHCKLTNSEPWSWKNSSVFVHQNFMTSMVSRGFCLPDVKNTRNFNIGITKTQAKQRFLTVNCVTVFDFKRRRMWPSANPAPQSPKTHQIEASASPKHRRNIDSWPFTLERFFDFKRQRKSCVS